MEQNEKELGQREMYFISHATLLKEPGIVEHKSIGSGIGHELSKKVDDIKNDWGRVMESLQFIIGETEKSDTNKKYVLDEITVSLGFSATGKIAFIAEAGVEASIEVTFKRQ